MDFTCLLRKTHENTEKIATFVRLFTKKTRRNMGFIIWIIGLVLCIKAVLEILKWDIDGIKKLLVVIILLLTSWVGLAVYYFWGRENLQAMLQK